MNDIDITTPQNITISYDLATVVERSLAFVLDAIILFAAGALMFGLTSIIFSSYSDIAVYFTVFPIIIFYSLVFEYYNNGQSIGKMALKLRVIRIDGEKTTFYDYLLRWVFRGIDIYLSAGSAAVISIMASASNQRTGDILGNTVVVNLRKSNRIQLYNLLNLNKQVNYTITYPDVVKFNEDTMILVKEVIRRNVKYPNETQQEALNLLVNKICSELKIKEPKDKKKFLNTLLKDYIILTR